jgi:hypothetical protein
VRGRETQEKEAREAWFLSDKDPEKKEQEEMAQRIFLILS